MNDPAAPQPEPPALAVAKLLSEFAGAHQNIEVLAPKEDGPVFARFWVTAAEEVFHIAVEHIKR